MVKSKHIFLIAGLVLAGLILLVGTALAEVPPGNWCGGSTVPQGDGVLQVKKDVYCQFERSWLWDILKVGDQTDLTLSQGQTFTVNYQVTASASVASADYGVAGEIAIRNASAAPVTLTDVSDSLGDVTCSFSLPRVLQPGNTVICTYSGSHAAAPSENTATVTYDGGMASATVPINWDLAAASETDECLEVTDSLAGPLGTVCAGDQTLFTFNYSHDILGGECGEFTVENVASSTTNDSGTTDSSSWIVNVDVPCETGCTLTPGYWKTHSMYGPAPYDETWALIGEDTPFFLSGKSYYNVLWTAPGGNAYYILAHAYIAAELNFLNGAAATPEVQTAFDTATGLFNTYTPAQIAALRGNSPVRQQFIALAELLDDYNNGLIGPGHCSEETTVLLSMADLYASNWVFVPSLAR